MVNTVMTELNLECNMLEVRGLSDILEGLCHGAMANAPAMRDIIQVQPLWS